jgi:hypothetical protein
VALKALAVRKHSRSFGGDRHDQRPDRLVVVPCWRRPQIRRDGQTVFTQTTLDASYAPRAACRLASPITVA